METKWKDVAHYYQFSDIEIQLPCGNRKFKGMTNQISGDSNHKKAFYLDAGGYFTRSTDANVSQYKPTLRHLDDMTEAEDNECMLVHTRWISNEEFKNVIWSLTKQHKTFDQYSTHWLISRGFDVFGLIESGQAIRKEMGNGNS